MATVKLSREEFEFVVNFLPAYGSLNTDDKQKYLRIMQLLASTPKIVSFFFPREKNYGKGKTVAVIKLIRTITGWGLKEAKDAYDMEHVFTLTDVKMTKEQVYVASNTDGVLVEFK